MALIKSTAIPSGATDYELEQSLKFNDDDNTQLERTFTSAGDRKKWTWSAWIKRGNIATNMTLFSAKGNTGMIWLAGVDGVMRVEHYNGAGGYDFRRDFDGYHRDASAWYHFIIVYDSAQGSEVDRIKFYRNGEAVGVDNTANAMTQNFQSAFNSNETHWLGAINHSFDYDGYMAEVNFVDGQTLTPADFGETGTYGEWKPIEYSGTYGTNGFYLPFKQDYTVEGFSAVTYKGTGASQYIGGTGYKPDLTWIKMRDGTDEHRIMDSVRGIPFSSKTTATAEDNDETTGFTSRSTDGFSVGSAGSYNNSSNKFVAWNWDMGADTPTGFSAVLYRGNASRLDVSGFGFSPDMVWIKPTTTGDHHRLCDTVRGVKKSLTVNETTAESTSSNNFLEAFNPDGFTIDTADGGWNSASHYYIAWCWDMGNTTATNTSGTISSQVRANPTYGQSIVSYTGNGTAGATVGHGLSSVPEMIIVKRRSSSQSWFVYHKDFGTLGHWQAKLNTTDAPFDDDGAWNDTAPSSSLITFGDSGATNQSSGTFIAYCFHSVSGYSKFGSYSGTGSANNAITLGFRPAFLMVKRTNSTEDWFIFDSTRNPLNTVNLRLKANTADADGAYSYVNFTDTGFSWQATGTGQNGSGDSYIYMAFAGGMDSISDYNTDGSIDSRVKASTTYGQSIVSYTGTGYNGVRTVGHGLSSAPNMVIYKNRSTTDNWIVWHSEAFSGNGVMYLENTTGGPNTNAYNNLVSAHPTSSVFSVNTQSSGTHTNGNGNDIIAYCFHDVTGYSKFGSYTGTGSTGLSVTTGFRPAFVMIKVTSTADSWFISDSTRDPSNPANKMLFANLSSAESTSREIDFDDNGFTIQNTSTSHNNSGQTYIYMAFADKREYAYWLDQSGNNNDWTSNNLTESDISVDSPTNNFATWNPLVKHTNVATTYAEGNLKATKAATYWTSTLANMYVDSGKWYAEFCCLTDGVYMIFGINAEGDLYANNHPGADANGYGYGYVFDTAAGRGDITYQDSTVSTGGAFNNLAVGTIIGITLDFDNNQVKFYANNVLQYTETIGARAYTYSVAPHGGSVVANFGQDSSFSGIKTAQGNQDGNDIGDFYYAPPTGFLALCTSNLPDVAVIPSEHFNPVIYTGNATARSITGVGFQPDFVWIKNRAATEDHTIYDVLRGAGIRLGSNYADGDDNRGSYGLTAFGSDGFTIGTGGELNGNNQAIVSWNWKANGSGASNTTGSINTTKTSANVDAGFSIITYSGNNTAGATIGHGLSKAPEMVIIKSRTNSNDWWDTYHKDLGASNALHMNDTMAVADRSYFHDTHPSSSVIYLGSDRSSNGPSETFVAYAFHSVDGYSKVGSYVGNGNADGTFVYTGFKPMMVISKYIGTENWNIIDTKRSPHNLMEDLLKPDSNAAEIDTQIDIDFLSNGFKPRIASGFLNGNGHTIIYIAFAETPFKYSNAR